MWADKMETAQKKYSKGDIPDIIAVSAMMPDSHISNLAFADSYVNTLMQYKNRGLIDEKKYSRNRPSYSRCVLKKQ